MPTEAQRFFQSNTDQDGTWGTDIDKLEDTAGTVVSTTVAQHPSSAGTTTIVLDPYTPRSATTDQRTLFGWAVNASGADGMESAADDKRYILAGTWRFLNRVTIPAGGTLTGSHNVIGIYSVYRVSAAGALALLFTVTSAEVAGGLLGSDQTLDISSAQAEIVLEPGETIHVAVQSRDRQVAGTLGGTTAGTITWHTGGAADAFVEVPTPGVRTMRFRVSSDVAPAGDGPITRLLYLPRALPETVQGTDLTTPVDRRVKAGRELVENVATTSTLERVYKSFRTLVESIPTVDELARFFKGFRSTAAETWPTTSALDRLLRVGRDSIESIPTTDAVARPFKGGRALAEAVTGVDTALARFFKGFRNNPEAIPTTETLALAFKGDRSITESVLTVDTVDRRFVGARLVAPEDIPIGADTLARFFKGTRDNPETIPTVDAADRTGKYGRSLDPETVQGVDFDLARKFVGTRALSETIPTTDDLVRLLRLFRDLTGTVEGVDIDLARSIKVFRELIENVPTVDVLTRLIKQRRFLSEFPTGVTPDYNVEFPTRKIAGIVRDQVGDPYEGAVVKLYRGEDDKMVQQTTSAADGSYEFLRDLYDIYTYYVTAYEETGDPTEGLTVRGLVPENV